MNTNSDQIDSVSEQPTDQYNLLNENPKSIDESDTQNATTPTTITIAEMDTDDVPIHFRVCFSIFYYLLNFFLCSLIRIEQLLLLLHVLKVIN